MIVVVPVATMSSADDQLSVSFLYSKPLAVIASVFSVVVPVNTTVASSLTTASSVVTTGGMISPETISKSSSSPYVLPEFVSA